MINNAPGQPEQGAAILLLGGRSEIGLAIVDELLREARGRGQAPVVVLAQRPGGEDARQQLLAAGAGAVARVDFDAEDLASHESLVQQLFAQRRVGHAVLAFGILGDQEEAWQQVAAAQRLVTVNGTAAVGLGVALAAAMRRQEPARDGSRGVIVLVSSVAATRVRRANFTYGASKQVADSFFGQLAGALRATGVRVLVVRPGAVATRMIEGRERVALTIDASQVARATVHALENPATTVIHVPRIFAPAMALARLVPEACWRRLPG